MNNDDGAFNSCSMDALNQKIALSSKALSDQLTMAQELFQGLSNYNREFLLPLLISSNYFNKVELERLLTNSPVDNFDSYMGLFEFNMDILTRYFTGSLSALDDYNTREFKKCVAAWYNTMFNCPGDKIDDFISRQSEMVSNVTELLPKAIAAIEPEYGFHFERGENPKFAETDRFIVYKIVPTDKTVTTDNSMKPVLIIPPFVLGSNILAFLPGENKSYAHSFANQGIPTYIRIMRDIDVTPAFQVMTLEEDALDTRYFCKKIMAEHGNPVTLNGYCQGGYTAVCNLLSGELDGLVDAFISCVSPMDGTRSQGLGSFLKKLPPRFNDLVYGSKTLENGNVVADGQLMGWVYKLKSIEAEAPMVSFLRDLSMVSSRNNNPVEISKTAAALNYWLRNERTDLPMSVTRMSFASYNTPVTPDGTLPVTMFGRKLNFKRMAEKKIAWLICYGESDDLVEKETALAPLDYVDAEVTPFPKGHVAIATSWSNPESACALHTRFGKDNCRGPVRFQLDLDKALNDREKSGTSPDGSNSRVAGGDETGKSRAESAVRARLKAEASPITQTKPIAKAKPAVKTKPPLKAKKTAKARTPVKKTAKASAKRPKSPGKATVGNAGSGTTVPKSAREKTKVTPSEGNAS